jgi:preprotein translocase subunit SecE
MATEEDLKKAESEEPSEEAPDDAADSPAEPADAAAELRSSTDSDADSEGEAEGDDGAPVQLGYQRYVYAAYMAGAMLVGFLAAKIGHAGWYRLGQWKPELGEPKDELLYPVAGLIGVLFALYYWRKADARQYANEVAEELSKVTWPSRKEVTNSTTVVVLTTVFATVFFALMDRFWGFITDKIYTF